MGMITPHEVFEEMKSNRESHHGITSQPPRCARENMHLFRIPPATDLMMLFVFVAVASCAFAQVIFNGTSSPVAAALTTATNTVTLSQTIPSQSNGLLVICVSMNNQQSVTSTVTSITDNGSAVGIFTVGTGSSTPTKSRVEIWALKSPPSGLNTIIITIPVTAPTVGVVAASADFAEVDQTTPFETFNSAVGSGNASSPTVTVASAAGEVVIDTVAIASPVTLTPATGQTQEWQTSSGVASVDTDGAGSVKAGSSPTATMTRTHTGPGTWAIGAVSIRSSIVTAVELRRFEAYSTSSGILLRWQVGQQADNLGFNIYRDSGAGRIRVNPSLIAGSALLMRGALPQHSGRTFAWIDRSTGTAGGGYWLEDVDVNGTRTMHGPVFANTAPSVEAAGISAVSPAPMLSQLSQAQPPAASDSHPVENVPQTSGPTSNQVQMQFELAAHPAVKILVRHEGWYRVAQPDLVKAGLDPNVDPRSLGLFAEAVEQPIQITGATAGPGGFGPQAAINFYGTGIDTLYSGTRVYWLVAGEGSGARIRRIAASAGSNQPPESFRFAVELEQRSVYFAALLTPNGDNFFGSFVSSTPVDQFLHVPHLDKTSTEPARLEVVLQGVVAGFPHDVTVALNGTTLGDVTFTGQDKGSFRIAVPAGLLQDGNNTVTLTAQNGAYDSSLVDHIRIAYPHSYVADSDKLKFTGRAGDEIKVTGFDNLPTIVLDITDPERPVELTPHVTSKDGKYELEVPVPWSTTNVDPPVRHTILAMADDRIASPSAVRANHPSHWHSAQPGAEIVMISHEDFAEALVPLVRSHRAHGKSAEVALIGDLYDEFNFGERSPFVIRQFLKSAVRNWKTVPKYLLLNGRASLDPRNYLGFGHLDLVPTKIVPTPTLMTASDDWFSDFNDSGMPTIATGRLPVGSADEAKTVIGKIVAYEGQSTNGPWTSQVLMVADQNDTENFSQDSLAVQAQLPSTLQVTDVFISTVGSNNAPQDIVAAINSGQLLVNFIGHGSEEQWSGENLFDTTKVPSLTNGSRLPVFLITNCLNGFFQDVYMQPLGVSLLLAPNGGAWPPWLPAV